MFTPPRPTLPDRHAAPTAAAAAPVRLRTRDAAPARRALVFAPTAEDTAAAFPEGHVPEDMPKSTPPAGAATPAPWTPPSPALTVARQPAVAAAPEPAGPTPEPVAAPDLDDPATAGRILRALDRELLEDVLSDILCAAARRSGVEV